MMYLHANNRKNISQVFFLFVIVIVMFSVAGCGIAPAAPTPIVPISAPATNTPSGDGMENTSPVVIETTPAPVMIQASSTPAPSPAPTPVPAPVATSFRDGAYTVTGNYVSPAGEESIGVTVTLKNDIIVAAMVKSEAVAARSRTMQGIFIENFKPLVIGKKISDVHLTKVSGSSLTPGGFNDALMKIEAEAKA